MNESTYYPVRYDETSIETASQEIAGMAREIRPRPAPPDLGKFAACRFCGQFITLSAAVVDTLESAGDAVEYATEHCECAGAKFYINEKRRREQAERTRQYALIEAEEAIFEKFGDCADLDRPVSQEVLTMLLEAAAMVFDCKIRSLTVSVSGKTKATISRNSKGKLLISRRESDTSQTEIG